MMPDFPRRRIPDPSLDPSWRQESVLTSVRLPGGEPSGGLLIASEEGQLLVLFAEEEVNPGDRVTVAPDLVLTVAAAGHTTLIGHRVTVLEVSPGVLRN